MSNAFVSGILITVLAGLIMGTSPWPLKFMRRFKYEHFAIISMPLALVVLPWSITLLFCTQPFDAFGEVPLSTLIKANLFSLCWGIAQVLAMLCFVRLGVSLTYGILCSVGAAVGVVMPMIFKASGVFGQGPDIFSPTGLVILAGAAILVVGVAFASLAGANREQTKNLSTANDATAGRGNFAVGLIMVIVAGVLSTGWGFAFTYSQDPIIAAMKARGASDIPANIAVWAIALLGATVPNVLYPVFLLTKNRSWSVLASKPSEIFLSAVYGVLFFAPSILLGIGMLRLGDRGASVGWGLVQGTLILGGQLLGFASGEWRGVAGKPRLQIYAAILILIAAMIVMASAKSNDAKALPEKATAESHLNGAS